jgi:hypothetical protein
MLSNDEEAWDDLDIKDNSFMYHTSRGIYSYYPDKDLSRACQSVSHPSFFDDDDTISTITSLHSDRFSVDDHDYSLSDNDDALGDGLTPYPTMKQQRHLRHPASSYSRPSSTTADFTDLLKGYEGPGTITRLERGGNRVHVDRGDWSQDLDLSATSLKLASMDLKRNSANQQYKKTMDDPFADFEDDTDDTSFFTGRSETSSFQKQVRFNSSLQPPPTTTTASNWKEEDDDEGFDDLDIPDRLSLKPYQPTTAPKSSPCAMPPALQKRLEQHIEKDDDDFLDGLDIKDAFKATPQPPPVKKGESKLPRLKQPRQPILFPSPSTSSRRKPGFENRLDRLTAPTYASRQRGRPEPSTTKPQPRQPKRIGTPAFVRTSDGSSLMARPRTSNHINYGNGSELDHLDDLAVWKRPSMARPSLKPPMSLGKCKKEKTPTCHSDPSLSLSLSGLKPKKPEPEKPWRCNMVRDRSHCTQGTLTFFVPVL